MADDDKDDFHILQEAAEKAGGQFKISYAANWMDLWRSILKALPDLIFLDLNMPVKDGFECLQLLRNETRYDSVPIIIYSTSLNKTDIDKAYNLRANYFIVKPNSMNEISIVLKKLYSLGKEILSSIPPREEFVIV
jgi:CheY-like chemotaxis protein